MTIVNGASTVSNDPKTIVEVLLSIYLEPPTLESESRPVGDGNSSTDNASSTTVAVALTIANGTPSIVSVATTIVGMTMSIDMELSTIESRPFPIVGVPSTIINDTPTIAFPSATIV